MEMGKHFKIQPQLEKLAPEMDIGSFIKKVALTISVEHEKFIDYTITKELYKIYQENKVTDVYVLDKDEFKKFLNEMLPVYMELHKND